jgi:hypothetical protein
VEERRERRPERRRQRLAWGWGGQRTVGGPLAAWAMAVALQTAIAHGGWLPNLLKFQMVV